MQLPALRACILPVAGRPAPWGEAASTWPVLLEPAGARTRAALAELGIEVVPLAGETPSDSASPSATAAPSDSASPSATAAPSDSASPSATAAASDSASASAALPASRPLLVLPEDLFLNAAFLRAFLEAATEGDCVAALAPSRLADVQRGRAWLGWDPSEPGAALPNPAQPAGPAAPSEPGAAPPTPAAPSNPAPPSTPSPTPTPLRLPLLLLRSSSAPSDVPSLLAACRAATPVAVDPLEESRVVPVPRPYREPGVDGITFSGARRVALHLTHRTHLLQANLDLLAATFLDSASSRASLALRFVWDKLRPGRTLLSKVGARCRIHPTAIVEACRLGDDVEVGANAILRGCVIGDGVVIEDAAHAQLSVLGPRSRLGRQTAVFLSVILEGAASASPLMQACVLGRHSAATSDAWFGDLRVGPVGPGPDGLLPGRTRLIRVETDPGHPAHPGHVDSGTHLLGCTVGHETFVGAGVITAAGRSLPSRVTVLGPKRYMVSDTTVPADAAPGSLWFVENGRLVPQDARAAQSRGDTGSVTPALGSPAHSGGDTGSVPPVLAQGETQEARDSTS